VFVGRTRELGELRQSAEEARAGGGRLVLLLGEPGIGKTRTASELTTYARLHGFQVLWGRCHEGGGAPAYWPWVQVIRAYLHDRDSAALRSEMGSGAPDIAQVVSEVRERLPDLPPPPALDAEQARFRLFDSITTFLKNAAGRQPLVLVLDDLHSADTPSLLLLQFLARAMEVARLLVVGTYRDLELGREHPLFQALGDLAREPVTRRIALHGLSEQDVGRYIEMTAGMTPPGPLVAVVHAETEGNPFFLGEVVQLLVAEGGLEGADARADWKPSVPQGVREVLGRRFGRLSAECNQVLAVASVVGREFALDVLEPVTGLAGDRLLERLDEAIAARVVVKVPDARGRFRFSHALVRETLYEELSTAQRVRLHRGIGEALEAIHGVRPERHLAALAYHFSQAADAANAEQAITYARRAGARAVTLLAYEEGARLYGTALEMLAVYRPTAELERGELLLELGEAQRRAGDIERAKEAFREAAALAKRLATPELLAHAALAYAGPAFVWQHDEAVPPLLEEVLASLGEPDGALRALVMARLATALYFAGSRDRCESLSARAVEMARRVGDPATLAHALHSRHVAVWGPRSLEERLAIATEIVTLAETIGDKEQVGRGRHLRIADLLELGEVAAAYREMEVQSRLADEMRQPLFHWHRAIYRTMRALLEGRFEEAERLAQETLAIGQRASPDAMETFAGQVFPQWREQGRLAEAEVSAAAFAAQQPRDPSWRVALGIIYLETGREADARREFEALAADDFAGIREDAVWLLVMSALCEICSGLRDAGRAATLYRMLSPYAARNVVAGAGVAYWGSLSFFLGLLATTMARWAEAARHFEAALEMNARMGAAPRVAHTQFAYARMLLEKALALKLRTQGVATADLKTSIDAVASTVQRERLDLTADAAPDGTVTVLFTDIEGYTAMTERLGDLRAQDVLRAHGAIVRQQVAAHGGREVKSQGDGFMIVFASARRAILCAIAVQRTIAGYSAAHPEEPIRVRIGLHTGEVIREAEDFFGKNVILAARIASEASGGEILVSSVSKELTESAGDLPFGDGRAVELKGLLGVRQVFDVRWAGTPAPERREVREARNVFRCEGEYWTLVFEGTVCRLRDAKGLHHIACLLRHPDEPFEARVLVAGPGGPAGASPVIELVGGEVPLPGLGDAGAMLDAKAKAAYRRRLEELREEREEADRFNDPARAARAREEIEFLTEQLAAAVGLGGRDRKAASAAERARLTVTKRIKDAVARIRESHLALGDHLAARIKTGYLCVYKPDAALPVSWEL